MRPSIETPRPDWVVGNTGRLGGLHHPRPPFASRGADVWPSRLPLCAAAGRSTATIGPRDSWTSTSDILWWRALVSANEIGRPKGRPKRPSGQGVC
jgi:hypothetical protein